MAEKEPRGGTQAYIDISAIAEASRQAVGAARITLAFLEMLVKEWNSLTVAGARSVGFRDLANIEIERLKRALEALERLQYPSHFKNGERKR